MRALHALLAAVYPLVVLSACGPKSDSPPPPPSQDGSQIISLRLRLRDGREVDVKTPSPNIDAVFTSAAVLDSILIPYYDRKGDRATADSLRRSRAAVGNPRAYAAHRLASRSSVEAIE